jgi:hypothetical protein
MYTHHKNVYIQNLLQEVKKTVTHYDEFIENYIRKGYAIGGELIFPKNGIHSINSRRGTNKLIRDRFDLTIECIRRFYKNEASPLSETLNENKSFLTYSLISKDILITSCCKIWFLKIILQ